MTVSSNQFSNPNIASTVPSNPQPNGPGGNTIVPTPATPNEWWKMLLATAIGAGGIWIVSTLGSEDSAKWLAFFVVLAIITYYETHGNKQFSNGVQELLGSIR